METYCCLTTLSALYHTTMLIRLMERLSSLDQGSLTLTLLSALSNVLEFLSRTVKCGCLFFSFFFLLTIPHMKSFYKHPFQVPSPLSDISIDTKAG